MKVKELVAAFDEGTHFEVLQSHCSNEGNRIMAFVKLDASLEEEVTHIEVETNVFDEGDGYFCNDGTTITLTIQDGE